MSAVTPGNRDGAAPAPVLLVRADESAANRLAHARRHFDIALDALAGAGPWTEKGPPATDTDAFVPGPSTREVPPLRWRHHGTDAHLHVTGLGSLSRVCVELFSRSTGRPAPIAITLEGARLAVDPEPGTLLRHVAGILRETDDAMGDPETTGGTIDTWAWAVVGHLRSRGADGIRAIDFPDAGMRPRIVGPDALLTEIPHPDMEAIAGIMPHARLVEYMGMDLTISRVRRIMVESPPPADPMAVLRTTALVAEAVERWSG